MSLGKERHPGADRERSKAEMTLKLISPAQSKWLDRALDAPVPPITFTLQTPAFHMPDLLKGERQLHQTEDFDWRTLRRSVPRAGASARGAS